MISIAGAHVRKAASKSREWPGRLRQVLELSEQDRSARRAVVQRPDIKLVVDAEGTEVGEEGRGMPPKNAHASGGGPVITLISFSRRDAHSDLVWR